MGTESLLPGVVRRASLLLAVAAVFLVKETASDFYQSRARREEDPRWAAVFRKQDGPKAAGD